MYDMVRLPSVDSKKTWSSSSCVIFASFAIGRRTYGEQLSAGFRARQRSWEFGEWIPSRADENFRIQWFRVLELPGRALEREVVAFWTVCSHRMNYFSPSSKSFPQSSSMTSEITVGADGRGSVCVLLDTSSLPLSH